MKDQRHYPGNYRPLQKLEVCSNVLIGGGDIAHFMGFPPVIIGQGADIPLLWLYARMDNEWVLFIEESKSNHDDFRVFRDPDRKSLAIYHKMESVVLSAEMTSDTSCVVPQIDLRPLGVNIACEGGKLRVRDLEMSSMKFNGECIVRLDETDLLPLKKESPGLALLRKGKFNPMDPKEKAASEETLNIDGVRLVKFCKPEHNPLRGCKKIRVGTTNYFSALEDRNELSDDTERTGFFNQNWEEGGETNNLGIVDLPNYYIFCTSLDDEPKFDSYSDKYYINDVKRFMELLQTAIAKQLQPHDFKTNIRPARLGISAYAARITYGKVASSNAPLLSGLTTDLYLDIQFRKPFRYQKEKEHRMLFIPVTQALPDKPWPLNQHPLSTSANELFDLDPLDEFLKIISLE